MRFFLPKLILQARLELATSAFLLNPSVLRSLSYKYHALTNCATGDGAIVTRYSSKRKDVKNDFRNFTEIDTKLFAVAPQYN